jgi:Icc-related predicted phosphoesterase
MKIVFIADVHNKISKVKLPPGDLLVIAGDLTVGGRYEEFVKLNNDLESITPMYQHGVLAIPGNHDILFEKDFNYARSLLPNVKHMLHHNSVTIEGINFWGSAFTPFFCDWAFNVDPDDLGETWSAIPDGVDVLVTHGPCRGILDMTPRGEPAGDPDLLEVILRVKPKIHCCGHIHYGYGEQHFNGIHFINASVCNERYEPVNAPIIVEI